MISRARLKQRKDSTWPAGNGGKKRGKDYSQSTDNDLIITGLVELRPLADDVVEVKTLFHLPVNGIASAWKMCDATGANKRCSGTRPAKNTVGAKA